MPAANEAGRIPQVSIGPADDVASRAQALLSQKRFVVAGLPTGEPGDTALEELIKHRTPNELLMVIETPLPARAPQLLPIGVLGLSPGHPATLTSASTHLDGIVAGIDIGPTALTWLGLGIPGDMKGEPIKVTGTRDSAALQSFSDRLRVVNGRRFAALDTILAAWLLLTLVLAIVADRRGVRTALRLGALAVMWVLSVLLVTAAVHPSRGVEMLAIALGSFLLAALTDRFVPWPRGPLVPCLFTILFYVVDLARGSEFIIRSLLGPNPRFGSRYYGLGNELEASLPVLLFIGLAALLYGRTRSRGTALAFGLAGLVFGAAVGSGRLGADVGGIITVGGGAAVATLPGADPRARRARGAGPRDRRQRALHADRAARARQERADRHRRAPLRARVQRAQTRADAIRDHDRAAHDHLRDQVPRPDLRTRGGQRSVARGARRIGRGGHRGLAFQRLRAAAPGDQHVRRGHGHGLCARRPPVGAGRPSRMSV
jgi:hypothetical protein